ALGRRCDRDARGLRGAGAVDVPRPRAERRGDDRRRQGERDGWIHRPRPSLRRDGRARRRDARERDAQAQDPVRPRLRLRGRRERCGDRARAARVTVVDIASIEAAGARFEPAGDDGIARIVIDRPNDSVNAIDPPLIAALLRAVEQARAAAPRGLVLASAKPDQFSGGADLKLLAIWPSPAELSEASRVMQRLCNELATLPCTTVAALNGNALAGGFELALACDWRVAADRPDLRVGLPEIQLGLIPAAGGTQRLPRLIGLPRTLDM